MKKQIKNLEGVKKTTTLFKSDKEVLDNVTGEVLQSSSNILSKEVKREKFIKLFIDNLDYIIGNLTRIEKDAFWVIMIEMNYHNIIRLDSGLRKSVQAGLDIAQGTVSKAIKGLIEKKVLLKIDKEHSEDYNIKNFTDKEYLVNPQLVGQGSFRELSKMRTTITTSFDFENLEIAQEKKIDTQYASLQDVAENLNNHEIKEIRQINSQDRKNKNTEVIITEKEQNKNDVIDINPQDLETHQPNKGNLETIQLELIREQNKSKELDNEKLRLQIHLRSMKKEKTLFDDDASFLPNSSDEDF